MSTFTYKNKTYTTKKELLEEYNLTATKVRDLEKSGMTIQEAADHLLEIRRKNIELAERATTVLGTPITCRKDLELFLKPLHFKYETQTLNSFEDIVLFLEHFYNTPYSFLIMGKGAFKYEDLEFPSLLHFFAYYKIVKPTLYRELVKNNFDVKQSILKCTNDPEYRVRLRPVVNGKTYDSILHLSSVFSIHGGTYMEYLREGLSFDEAFAKCIESKNRWIRFDNQLPIDVMGRLCNNLEEIADVLNVKMKSLKAYLIPYDNLADFVLDYGDIYNKKLKADAKKEIMKKWGLTYEQVTDLVQEHEGDFNATIDKLEMLRFEYQGKTLYPFVSHVREYGLTGTIPVGRLKKALLAAETLEEKNKIAKECIDNARAKNKQLVTSSSIFT